MAETMLIDLRQATTMNPYWQDRHGWRGCPTASSDHLTQAPSWVKLDSDTQMALGRIDSLLAPGTMSSTEARAIRVALNAPISSIMGHPVAVRGQ